MDCWMDGFLAESHKFTQRDALPANPSIQESNYPTHKS